jgi:hypothetical protein
MYVLGTACIASSTTLLAWPLWDQPSLQQQLSTACTAGQRICWCTLDRCMRVLPMHVVAVSCLLRPSSLQRGSAAATL